MKRLRTAFKNLSWLLLKNESDSNIREQRDFMDFELSYYEAIFISEAVPKNAREALDCIDLIILHERDDQHYADWPRMADLYKKCLGYLRANSNFVEDPIYGKGRYELNRIRPRYEFKRRYLRGYAERKGFVIV